MRGKRSSRNNTHVYERTHRSGRKTWLIRWKDPKSGQWVSHTAGKTADEATLIEAQVRKNLTLGLAPFPDTPDLVRPMTVAQVIEEFYESPKFLTAKPLWQVDTRRRI